MIQPQFQAIYNVAAGTSVVQLSGNLTVHTLNFPKATAGIVKLASGDQATTIINLPAASIGSLVLDIGFATGLSVWAASADAYILTYQTP